MSSLVSPGQMRSPQPPADLGRRAARGLIWMMSQTLGVKILSMIANVVLARLLMPNAFGLVGLSYTVMSIAGIVQYLDMQDVLVQRRAHFRRWSNPAFWMSLTMGLIGGSMIAIAAPIGAVAFHEPRLVGMILLLALASPLQTAGMVPQAALSAKLRFRTIVVIGAIAAAGNSVLSVLFAWLGCGAYSFVLPAPILAIAQTGALWLVARPPVHWTPQFHLWRFLVRDTGYNWGISICRIIITTADLLVVGKLFSKAAEGIYYNAVLLSTQLLRLLANNLMGVLLPSLSTLQHDPQRQTMAFLQAARILAMLGVPACLLQAALAGPLIRIFYKPEFHGMIPVLQALSIGMAFSFVSGPATSMMKAQGRFRGAFLLYAMNALIVTLAVSATALMMRERESEAAFAVASASAACMILFGPLSLALAVRRTYSVRRALAQVYGSPTIAGSLSTGAAMLAARLASDIPGSDYFQFAILLAVTGVAYPMLIRALDTELWNITMSRWRAIGLGRPRMIESSMASARE